MLEAEKELGLKRGTVAALESFLGASVSTYGPRTEDRGGSPAAREKQIEKDLKNITWDAPEKPAYAEFLTDEQLVQFRKAREKKRGLVMYNAAYTGKSETSVATRDKNKAYLEAMKAEGITHEQAQDLLYKYWYQRPGEIDPDKYGQRGVALSKLYGKSAEDFTKWWDDYSKNNLRASGEPKGQGWLGPIKLPGGGVASEYTIGVEFDGQETEIPTLVPTLTEAEVERMRTDIIPNKKPVPKTIKDKAVAHARQRMKQGKSPFVD